MRRLIWKGQRQGRRLLRRMYPGNGGRMLARYAVLTFAGLIGIANAVADAPGLREALGAERFDAFGLSRLTPDELARLEAWLAAGRPAVNGGTVQRGRAADYGPPSAPVLAEDDFGEEQIVRERRDEELGERIRAHIQGPFEGWEGKTLFRLDNGQIWRQRIGGRYRYRADSPLVEIVKGRFGYYLELVETGRQVGVKRIR